MPEQIDYAYVSGLREHLTRLWSPAYGNWKTWHDIHDQRHRVQYALPANVRKLGIARAKLGSMVDTLVTDKPEVTRKPVAEGQVHKDKADKVEKWANGLLHKAMTSGSAIPPFRSAGTFLGLLGYATGVVRWDDKIWDANARSQVKRGPGYMRRLDEAKRSQAKAFPFVIEFPHPARMLLPHQERRPSVGIEIASMYAWQVEEMLAAQGLDATDVHADRYAVLEVLNYWDEKKKGLFIEGREAEVRDNGLGIVPFVHGFSGYGHEHMPTSGYAGSVAGSAGPLPEDLAVGLLAGVTDSIIALDEASTALTYLVQLAAYPNYFTSEDAEELAGKLNEAGLGGIVQVGDPAKALRPSEIPQMGAWVFEQIAFLRRDIDEGTFHGAIGGEVSPNVRTASGQAMQIGQIFRRFQFLLLQLGLMAGELLGLCARMTALRGESVTIDGFTCSAEDFEGNYDFEVDFMAKDEGARLRQAAAANEGYKLGTESFEGVQEAKGVTDVTGKWKEVMIGKAKMSNQYQEAVLTNAITIVQQRMAEKQAREAAARGMPPMTPASSNGQPPQGFAEVPGGPQEAQQVKQGMEQVPDLTRTVPNG